MFALTPSQPVDESHRLADWIARTVSGEVRALQRERNLLAADLRELPAPAGFDTGTRLGWHSPRLSSAGSSVWAQVDLGADYDLDLIALVAASGEADGKAGAGYGFLLRFRIEVADSQHPMRRSPLGDFTSADVPNPGAYPFLIPARKTRARYVRFTATQAWPRQEDWIVALGEIMVLVGKRNVAAGQPVTCSLTSTADPYWNPANLTDQQSVLGPPVSLESSPSNGYLAIQEANPNTTKWVQVDLGESHTLDEIRLFPTRPTDFADIPGHGFPARFLVELSENPDLHPADRLLDFAERPFLNPGENPVSVRAGGRRGRYVRVTALELQNRGASSSFALAELQAWSGDRNVALHAPVTCLDSFESPQYPRWRPEYLVDGFNSRHRLLDFPQWLASLDRRHRAERELALVQSSLVAATERVLATTLKASVVSTALLGLAVTVGFWRNRRVRRRAVEQLRRRVAADLHDEIGSYLGSIRLLSDAASREPDTQRVRSDLSEIGRIASQTSDALREIVWLIDARVITLPQLIARMREAMRAAVGGLDHEFTAPEICDDTPCSLEFARNLWLIYKEALHNAVRHSGCRRVEVSLSQKSGGGLTLEIRDDGRGFRESEIEAGRGLHNLRERAQQLRGRLTIQSEPGQGTRIRLDLP